MAKHGNAEASTNRLPLKYLVKNVASIGEIPHKTVVNAYLGESWLGSSSDEYAGAYDRSIVV